MTDKQNYFTYTDNTSDNNDKIMENLHKQIIDGVNVKGCKRRIGKDNYCRYYKIPCSENNYNCIWKKYLRKEQECKELKEKVKKYGKINEQETKDYAELKSENDGLKTMLKDLSYENQKFCYQIEEQTKQLEPFKDEYFKGLDNVVIAELAKKSIRITVENSKLEQTLAEIKEIAEWHTTSADSEDVQEDIKQILQKISECEVENE